MRTALVLCLVGLFPMVAAADELAGSYLEARTASVFAGGCHFNAEYDTAGRKATMAFHFEQGDYNGVSLAGVNIVVSVAADRNLVIQDVEHVSVIYVDAAATPAQQRASAAAINEHYAAMFGTIVATRVVPISFERKPAGFAVRAGSEVALIVDELPNRECCSMPSAVWYKPFAKLTGRMVGMTIRYHVKDAALPTTWSRSDENGAFYGRFTLPGVAQLAGK